MNGVKGNGGLAELVRQPIVPAHEKMEKLSEEVVRGYLSVLDGWELAEGALTRTFQFSDFLEAMQFVNMVGYLAERVQHHPDIVIQYNRVTVRFWTHAVDGITINDVLAAARVEWLYRCEKEVGANR